MTEEAKNDQEAFRKKLNARIDQLREQLVSAKHELFEFEKSLREPLGTLLLSKLPTKVRLDDSGLSDETFALTTPISGTTIELWVEDRYRRQFKRTAGGGFILTNPTKDSDKSAVNYSAQELMKLIDEHIDEGQSNQVVLVFDLPRSAFNDAPKNKILKTAQFPECGSAHPIYGDVGRRECGQWQVMQNMGDYRIIETVRNRFDLNWFL